MLWSGGDFISIGWCIHLADRTLSSLCQATARALDPPMSLYVSVGHSSTSIALTGGVRFSRKGVQDEIQVSFTPTRP
ncbi:hypothetical protein B0H16DRAFT_1566035, partial [Mycena metata]